MIEPVSRSFAVLEALSRRPHGTIAALRRNRAAPADRGPPAADPDRAGLRMRMSRELGYRLTDRCWASRRASASSTIWSTPPRRTCASSRASTAGRSISARSATARMTIRHSTAAGKPDVVRADALQRRSPILPARSAAPGSPSARTKSAAPSCVISACAGRGAGRRLRAHPARRLCLHRAAALGQASGHRRADPQARARPGLHHHALHPLDDERSRGRQAIRNGSQRACHSHCHRRRPLARLSRRTACKCVNFPM